MTNYFHKFYVYIVDEHNIMFSNNEYQQGTVDNLYTAWKRLFDEVR
jgi:hypothetical protein